MKSMRKLTGKLNSKQKALLSTAIPKKCFPSLGVSISGHIGGWAVWAIIAYFKLGPPVTIVDLFSSHVCISSSVSSVDMTVQSHEGIL